MKLKSMMVVLIVFASLIVTTPARAMIWISEFLADPATDLTGDANHDGVSSSSDDEFVELFNAGPAAVDISGWSLSDATKVRHVFPAGTSLSGNELFVVFGGGAPSFSDVRWQVASTGQLSLNNPGDTITLRDTGNVIIDQVVYGPEAGNDQSLSRSPEGDGAVWVTHTTLPNANGQRFSPGKFVGRQINPPETQSAVVPEPGTLCLVGMGLLGLVRRRQKVL